MSSRIRILPTLMGAVGVLLCLRIGAMAASSEPEKPAEPAVESQQPAEASEKPEGQDQPSGEEAASADQVQASAVETQQMAQADTESGAPIEAVPQSRGEADVLQRLGERRAALDARERDLGLREQLLLAAEKQIDARLQELRQLEQKLDVMMAKRNEQDEAQLVALVKSYESMKPDDAARIFNRLERGILVDVSSRMKPAKIGAVLAAMEPARAQDLTVLLAKRLKPSLAQVPTPAAPVPAPTPVLPPAPIAVEPQPAAATDPVPATAPHG